jgi:hypothetical protein
MIKQWITKRRLENAVALGPGKGVEHSLVVSQETESLRLFDPKVDPLALNGLE